MDVAALANPGLRKLEAYRPGKSPERLEREQGIANAIKLASNENALGASPEVRNAIRDELGQLHRYPDPDGWPLKEQLARQLKVAQTQLVLGNGSNELLELLAKVFLGPGRSAVYCRHAFIVYPLMTRGYGALAAVSPLSEWRYDLNDLVGRIRPDTRLLLLANPNNPTGSWIDRRGLEFLLRQVPRQVIVVLDEAYCEYADDPEYPNGMEWLPEHPNLVVLRTFSKIHGLAGLRIGYSISSPEIADLLNRARAPFNINQLARAAACAALADQHHVEHSRKLNLEQRQALEHGLDELGLEWLPSQGNFLSFALPGDAEPFHQGLLQEKVIVRPLVEYEMPRHLRVSVGLPEENQRFLQALAQVLQRVGERR